MLLYLCGDVLFGPVNNPYEAFVRLRLTGALSGTKRSPSTNTSLEDMAALEIWPQRHAGINQRVH